MTPSELLAHLQALGLRLRSEGGRLLVSPAALVTDELAELVREHREALLALLAPGPFALSQRPGTRPVQRQPTFFDTSEPAEAM